MSKSHCFKNLGYKNKAQRQSLPSELSSALGSGRVFTEVCKGPVRAQEKPVPKREGKTYRRGVNSQSR